MPLWASGQWLVDAGVRSLSHSDQLVWRSWAVRNSWLVHGRRPSLLPSAVALVASKALKTVVDLTMADLREGRLSKEDALHNLDDIDAVKAALTELQADIY